MGQVGLNLPGNAHKGVTDADFDLVLEKATFTFCGGHRRCSPSGRQKLPEDDG
ncbi:MAG: hypothetical protein H5U03_06860 [Clostridia bacterium]|nr:hypothetical protein [Clostridia bacterium]